MVNLNKNYKMILGGLGIIIIGVVGYYIMYVNTKTDYTDLQNIVVEVGSTSVLQKEIPDEIVIHVTGCVVNEGVVRLAEGSRVADVIEAARRRNSRNRLI